MKRKPLYVPGSYVLQLHTLLFIVFTVCLWMSTLATLTYPGNAAVPIEVFKPLLISRMTLNALWGMLLLGHFAVQQFRLLFQLRHYQAGLESLEPMSRVLVPQAVDAEALAFDEEQGRFKLPKRKV